MQFDISLFIRFLLLIAVDSMLSTSLERSRNTTSKNGKTDLLPDNEEPESLLASSLPDYHNENESCTPSNPEAEPQKLAKNLQTLKLEKHLTNNKNRKKNSSAEYKPEKWMLSDEEETLSQLNLAIVS